MRKKVTVTEDDVVELITDRYPKSFKPILMYDIVAGYTTGYYDNEKDKFYSSKITILKGKPIAALFSHRTVLENVSGWVYLGKPFDAISQIAI